MNVRELLTREQIAEHMDEAVPVITPTIQGREVLLDQCMRSVRAQTIPVAHHVALDATKLGPAFMRNAVLERLQPTSHGYVAFLDDDDLMDPDHIDELSAAAVRHGADLVFSWHRREGLTPDVERVEEWSDYAFGCMLGGRNLIPVTVLARHEAIMEAGAFREDDRYEDYDLWMRMLANGCRFEVVPRETWTYRMQGGNRTWA